MKFFNKVIQSTLIASTVVSTILFSETISSSATQLEIPPMNTSKMYGTSYWKSSNIREWLNSDSTNVSYTMNNPSYKDEAGFLTNFTEQEKSAIAVTRRRNPQTNAYWQTVEGGDKHLFMQRASNSIGFSFEEFSLNWKNYHYYKSNEKVFLLSIPELFFYGEGKLDSNIIPYSKEAQERLPNPEGNKYHGWMTSSGFINPNDEDYNFYITKNGHYSSALAYYKIGVVPAMHIKPNYIFSNGKRADSLNIGDKVNFGMYRGYDIEWMIINKTSSGYPLLLSTTILDDKEFNAPSDTIYKESNSVNFPTYDVDISEDLSVFGKNGDNTIPNIRVVNESDMFSRKIGSYNITVESSDNSGIQYMILPNGNKIFNQSQVTYTVSNNEYYYFGACDNNGNKRRFIVPIGNINQASHAMVTPSTKEWTKENISVDIRASNDVGTNVAEQIQGWRDQYLADAWPNYNSYANKVIRISGSVELISSKSSNLNIDIGIGVHFKNLFRGNTGDYHVGAEWLNAKTFNLQELKNSGKQNFSVDYTVPGNYYMDLLPWTTIMVSHTNNDYTVKWSNIKYELLDNDDFGIQKIVLPNGTEVNSNKYVDTLTSHGDYTYRIYDKNGRVYSETVTALIDKASPEINLSYDTNFRNTDLDVDVLVTDKQSGLSNLVLPDGSNSNKSNITYSVSQNGNLVFTAIDNVGNSSSKSVNINNIDKIAPRINGTVSYLPDKSSGKLTISVEDDGSSGLKQLQNYKGETITNNFNIEEIIAHNGYYTFIATDKAGNKTSKTFNINDLNNNFSSGIKEIRYKLEGATVKDWTKYTGGFTVINEGVTTLRAIAFDKAGNSFETSSTVKVDKTSPNMLYSVSYNPEKTIANVSVSGNDPLSGVKNIVSHDGTVINNSSYSFEANENGQFLVSSVDNANNMAFLSVTVDQLTSGDISSGIKEIRYKLEGATTQDWTDYTTPFNLSNEGTTIVKAKSYDKAGNLSDETILEVKIDKTKPTKNQLTINVIK